VYCEDLTSSGITDVLRIINEGSKLGRHKSMIEDGEDDDDDILEDDEDEEVDDDVEETEESKGAKAVSAPYY
jgi:DNA polymerase phi